MVEAVNGNDQDQAIIKYLERAYIPTYGRWSEMDILSKKALVGGTVYNISMKKENISGNLYLWVWEDNNKNYSHFINVPSLLDAVDNYQKSRDRFLSLIINPSFVSFVLAILIVLSIMLTVIIRGSDHIDQSLISILLLVVGFYFGRKTDN